MNTRTMIKVLVLSSFLITIQACSNPQTNEQNSVTRSPASKKFGDRFSSTKIKQERENYYAQKRFELKRISPKEKVRQALQANNIYLMEVSAGRGGVRSIPGLANSNVPQVSCKTVSVEGMGDVLYGKNHMLYRQELLQYMQQFNLLMMPHCK